MQTSDKDDLIKAARGGRVAHTGFLEPDDAARLSSLLRQANLSVYVSGGFPGARRRVLTVFPEAIPEATTALAALYAEGLFDEQTFRSSMENVLSADSVGDIIQHGDGLSVIILDQADSPKTLEVHGQTFSLEPVPLDHVAKGSLKRHMVIVPSLRIDALGAKAFNVSRSYFSKGIKAGNVRINGKAASKSSSVEAGDEVYAEGLGRFYLVSVEGETRRGNLKTKIDIEKR